MNWIYIITCACGAILLPHLSHSSATTLEQIILQSAFVLIGISGFKTFSE